MLQTERKPLRPILETGAEITVIPSIEPLATGWLQTDGDAMRVTRFSQRVNGRWSKYFETSVWATGVGAEVSVLKPWKKVTGASLRSALIDGRL